MAARPHCPIHACDLQLGNTRWGRRWACPAPGCTMAMWDHHTSTPADEDTRQLRRRCHLHFDVLWAPAHGEDPPQVFASRARAYRWLEEFTGRPVATSHIGYFNARECRRLLSIIAREPWPDTPIDEEERFQNGFDEARNNDELDFTGMAVFADWLDEHGDPRAEGYRGLSRMHRFPSVIRHGDPAWSWHRRWPPQHLAPWSDLPEEWFDRLRGEESRSEAVKYFTSGWGARDAGARAWVLLPRYHQEVMCASHDSLSEASRTTVHWGRAGQSAPTQTRDQPEDPS